MVVDAPSLPVFKRHLDSALNNRLHSLVSTKVVRQLDWVIVLGHFHLEQTFLFYSVTAVGLANPYASVRL